MLSLTDVEHGCCCGEGHEVDAKGEGHHANQDDCFIAGKAPEHHGADETSEENPTSCCVPVPQLKGRRKNEVMREDTFYRQKEIKPQRLTCTAVQLSGAFRTNGPSNDMAPPTAKSYRNAAVNSRATFNLLILAGPSTTGALWEVGERRLRFSSGSSWLTYFTCNPNQHRISLCRVRSSSSSSSVFWWRMEGRH